MEDVETGRPTGPNWREVGVFIALTFSMTAVLNIALWLTMSLDDPAVGAAVGTVLQAQMLFPALAAIVLGMFFFRDSRIYRSRDIGRARLFLWYFLLLSALYVVSAVAVLMSPDLAFTFGSLTLAAVAIGLLLLLGLRLAGGRESFARAGLTFGKARHWVIFSGILALFYSSQAALNYIFGLGSVPDLSALMPQAELSREMFLLIAGLQTVLVGPILGLIIGFGEEYGWRGYLQSELVRMGRVRGMLVLGVIWGIWHAPVIAMGHNYPGYPVLGPILMIVVTIVMAFFFGYVVLKTGSVILAAFLHAFNNQFASFILLAVYRPDDPVFSFGFGIYGLAIAALVILLILRDPVWKGGEQVPSPWHAPAETREPVGTAGR
jgi:uncharacterized protein